MEFKPLNQKIGHIKSKHQKHYTKRNAANLPIWSQERYFNGVMNDKTGFLINAWKTERYNLNAAKRRLNGKWVLLKSDTTGVSNIRRNVYELYTRKYAEHSLHESKISNWKNKAAG